MKQFLKYSIACLVILIAELKSGYAQTDLSTLTDNDTLSLKDLLNVKVTTASKNLQELEMAPATVVVVTKEQIKMRGYQSLLDVMYDLPDVKIDDKIYSGTRNNFVVRGTPGQDKFIILLDGNRISSPIDEALPVMENYPVNFAEQIEIVYGPASALYGADAVSGVINIITKKNPSKKSLGIEASSIAGTYGYTNNTLFISKKINDKVNLVVSGQYAYDKGVDYSKLFKDDSSLNVDSYSTDTIYSIYGPLTSSKSISPHYEAPTEAYNIYAAINATDFTFSYFRNYSKTPSAYGTNTSNSLYNKDAFIAQGVDMINSSYKKSFQKFTSSTLLTGSTYNLNPKSNYRNLYTNMDPAYKYETCTMLKGEEQLDYKPSEKLNFTLGTSYEIYSVVPYSADLDLPVNQNEYVHGIYLGTDTYYKPDGLAAQFYFIKYHNSSAYFQTQYSPEKKINFTLGVRYDNNSRYGSTINPRLGIVFKPFSKTTIKALYGSAFLAPSPADNYAYWGSFVTADSGKTFHSYFMHLPNPDLKPITSKNAEINIRQYITNDLSVTLDGYYTVLSGLHAFADDNNSTHLYNNSFNGIPVDYIEIYTNQSLQESYGGSIQANWKASAGRIRTNSFIALSYVNGVVNSALTESEETTPDIQLEFISPFMLHAGVDLKAGKFSFSPRLILMGKQNLTGISDTTGSFLKRQTIAGYALLNLTVRFNVVKKISVFGTVNNALNQKYKSVGYGMDLTKNPTELFRGQPEDPIRFNAGININF